MPASVPGMRSGRTVTPRNIFFDKPSQAHVVSGTIDNDLAYDAGNDVTTELREGTIMARLTSSKKWCPCLRTKVTSNGGATSADIPVDDARHFQVGMEITVGGDTGKTISSINRSTNTITVSDSAFTFANNDDVTATTFPDGLTSCAGAELARGVLAEVVDVYDHDSRTNVDRQTGKIVDQGNLLSDSVIGSNLTEILASTHNLDHIKFYDDGVWIG